MSFTIRKLRSSRGSLQWTKRLLTVITLARPLYRWYHNWHQARQKQQQRIGLLKRLLSVLVAVLLAVFLLGAVAKAIMSIRGIGLDNVLQIAGTAPPTDQYGLTNILLLGQGDKDHDGKNLTDTIMVASLDPEGTQSAVLLSLPRDLYFLKTERMGKGKLNTFYRDFKSYLQFQRGMTAEDASQEALKELADEVGRKLGLEIHHTVKVDFIAFTRAVDVLGGVDIEVPYDIEDLEYPDNNYGYEPFILKAGPRHLDGETALKYARSRHTSSDFGRSARQQQLLSAMAHKAKEEGVLLDPAAITSFTSIMAENVDTTMTLRELIGLAELGQKLDRSRIITMQLSDRNALYDSYIEPGGFLYTPPRNLFDGVAVLLPVSIPEYPVTFKQIKALTDLMFRHRELHLEPPTIAVLNAGAPSGTARKLAYEFIRYGFTVPVIENADSGKQDTSQIVAHIEPNSALNTFATLLGLETRPAPEGLPESQQRPITIILGRDFTYRPLQDLIPNIFSPAP